MVKERYNTVDVLVWKVKSVVPFLKKVERLVADMDTGFSPHLASCYTYWERKIYQALLDMILRNLLYLDKLILADRTLFYVETDRFLFDVKLQPSATNICKMALNCMHGCVETTKHFVRWMHGTCTEAPPQHIVGMDEPFIFTFYEDVVQEPRVSELTSQVCGSLHRLLACLSRHLLPWEKYRLLWNPDNDTRLERFVAKQPNFIVYEERLSFYTQLVEDLSSMPAYHDEQCVRLRQSPLFTLVKEMACKWLHSLCQLFGGAVHQELLQLREEFEKLSEDLRHLPHTLDDLKLVLSTTAHVRKISLDTELRIQDLQEKYHTMEMHSINISAEELSIAGIQVMWKNLQMEAKRVSYSLGPIKKKFTSVRLSKQITL
uniref:Uncharacterized protein n=1 Tax=Eptatretus burgeri TaxID=7764 RepID=A0A8C4NHV0_EPTBU